jgi:acetyl-CoA carboxylase, biotin carboxylase subunit
VPVVPGAQDTITSDEEAIRIIRDIGLPVMIKASAGGGGKGMRLVTQAKDIKSALRAARSEALQPLATTLYSSKNTSSRLITSNTRFWPTSTEM